MAIVPYFRFSLVVATRLKKTHGGFGSKVQLETPAAAAPKLTIHVTGAPRHGVFIPAAVTSMSDPGNVEEFPNATGFETTTTESGAKASAIYPAAAVVALLATVTRHHTYAIFGWFWSNATCGTAAASSVLIRRVARGAAS